MKIKIHAKLITFLIIFNGFMQLPLLTNGQGASINSNGNPADTSAMLDVSSTTQGVLLPRMTTSQRNAINLPATGLIIYNIDCNSFNYNAGTPSAPNWLPLNAIDLLATPETISGSSDVCSNLSGVTYSIIPVSGATLYNWSLPVGATITAGIGTSSITVSFGSNAGNVCVVASNDCGTSDASCKSISITPPPVINITNNTSGGGTEVTCSITPISVECTTGYSAYLWSGGNSTNTAANTWTSAGTYTVTVTSVNGCTATSSIVTTENTTAPTEYSVTGGGSYCSGGTGVAVGLNNSQIGVNYQLKIGGSNTGSPVAGTGSAINFGNQTTEETYTVYATNTANNCTADMTGSVNVSINTLPVPSFTTQPGASAGIGADVTYTTQASMTAYVWGFPGELDTDYSITSGGTSDDNTVTLKYLTSGSKTVTINYTNSNGCTAASATSSTATTISSLYTCGDILNDSRDSKTYNTLLIGTQCWMAQNLNYSTSGVYTPIATRQGAAGIQKYCYEDSESNCNTYGGLYEWTEMMDYSTSCNGTGSSRPACTSPVRGICPDGWHIPSHYEWTQLERAVCTSGSCDTDFPYNTTTKNTWLGTDEGNKLRETGSTHWTHNETSYVFQCPEGEWFSCEECEMYFGMSCEEVLVEGDPDATNSSGFTGLPGGMAWNSTSGNDGYYSDVTNYGSWWSATEDGTSGAFSPTLSYNNANLALNSVSKSYGYSVRCVYDKESIILAFSATEVGCKSFVANWKAVLGATSYYIDVATDNGFASILGGYNNLNIGDITSYIVTGLTTGITYYYRLRAESDYTTGNSNTITVTTVNNDPIAENAGLSCTSFTANWNSLNGATSYCIDVSTNSSFTSFVADYNNLDVGNVTSYNVTNLTASTTYYYRLREATPCVSGNSNTIQVNTNPLTCCPFTVNHTAGNIAPVTKTVTYGTVQTSLSGASKCWITQNLGSSNQATSAIDTTNASAGWYWRFNRLQGFKVGPTPAWSTYTKVDEPSGWVPANDPCTLLGSGWRIPTNTEWTSTNTNGGWTGISPGYISPYASVLKLHIAGYMDTTAGLLIGLGSNGRYWSSTQQTNSNSGGSLSFTGTMSYMTALPKAYGLALRCLKD